MSANLENLAVATGLEHGPFSFQSQRKVMPKNAQTTTQLHSSHMLVMDRAMATHSSALAWKIPWMEEPGGLQSMGLRRVRHDRATSLSLYIVLGIKKKKKVALRRIDALEL